MTSSPPLRVMQIHNRYVQPGGEDTVADAEKAVLESGGHTVLRVDVRNQDGLGAVPALAVSSWNPWSAAAVTRAVNEFEPDVAHVHNTWFRFSPSVVSAIHAAGVPVAATVHNFRLTCLNGQLFREGSICEDCVGRFPLPGIRHGCYRGSRAQSAVIAANVSLGRANDYWQHKVSRFVVATPFSSDLLASIGVDPDRIHLKPHFASPVGDRANPPSTSSEVLFVGRLSAEKGVRELLEAWSQANPTHISLVMIGDGPLRQELESKAPKSVRFLGWLPRDEVRQVLLTARALMFPSVWYETFGMVLIEAMAAGLPIVASDIGGIRFVLGEEASDELCPPGDVAAWVGRIRELDEGGSELDSQGGRNLSRYLDEFTPQRGLADLEDLYTLLRDG